MRLDVLRNFTVLAEEKSMTRTARILHISQPTLSRQMASLESDLGIQLYTREEGMIKLTPEALEFYNYAASIVELESRAREALSHTGEIVSGSIYIGYGDSGSMKYIYRAINALHKKHERVQFSLIAGSSHSSMQRLSRGSIDFMLEPQSHLHGKHHSLLLPGDERIVAIVNKKDKLAGKKVIRPKDLEGEMLIASRRFFDSPEMKEWAGSSYGRMNVAIFFNIGANFSDLLDVEGRCIIAHQDMATRFNSDQFDCIPLDPPLCEQMALVWREDRKLSSAASAFVDELHAIISEASAD